MTAWLARLVQERGPLTSPVTVAMLIALAVLCGALAVRPRRRTRERDRLDGYVQRQDVLEREELSGSLMSRVVAPALRNVLRRLGNLLPSQSVERTRKMLVHAGEPGHLTVLDYQGLRVLLALILGAMAMFVANKSGSVSKALQAGAVGGVMGFLVPAYWVRSKAKKRRNQIGRALPNAIDMMTIGVEAGLAFESAMLRVAQKWRNALTIELARVLTEVNVGVSREEALRRMADRTDVPDLRTFVAVLVQSSELGMSIADVLHTQAAQMRLKRRQRAEEIAHQASIKLVVVLVFFVFPALFIVILGPQIPRLISVMATLGGG
jgi:tight adherence protein C